MKITKNRQGKEAKFHIREGTKDELIIDEVLAGNTYFDRSFGNFRDGNIVIDIGAHIGSFAIDAALRGATVVCYEPHPDNFALLLKNIELNGLTNRIKPINKAVSNTAGSFDLYLDSINSGSHSLNKLFVDNPTKDKIKVEVLKFSNILIGFKKVELLKLDCEGGEYNILLGTNLRGVKNIRAELHDRNRFGQLLQYLLDNGFRVSGQHDKRLGKVKANR